MDSPDEINATSDSPNGPRSSNDSSQSSQDTLRPAANSNSNTHSSPSNELHPPHYTYPAPGTPPVTFPPQYDTPVASIGAAESIESHSTRFTDELPDYRFSRLNSFTSESTYSNDSEGHSDPDTFNVHALDVMGEDRVPGLSLELSFTDPHITTATLTGREIIHGVATLKNEGDCDVEFDMFLMNLEGTRTYKGRKTNFVQMLDSSCSVGHLKEHDKPLWKVIKAGRTYTRPFVFQVPDAFLETNCKHSFSSHMQLPPSSANCGLKLAQVDIEYAVTARLICHQSMVPNTQSEPENDALVVLKQVLQPLRIIPATEEPTLSVSQQMAILNNLKKAVDTKIEVLQRVNLVLKGRGTDDGDLAALIESIEEDEAMSTKGSQLYRPIEYRYHPVVAVSQLCHKAEPGTITLCSEPVNVIFKDKLQLATPWQTYVVPFSSQLSHKVNVPLKLTHKKAKFPKLKSSEVKLVVLTLNSQHPLPIEFNHRMFFTNTNCNYQHRDDFRSNIINVFREKFDILKSLAMKLGPDRCRIDNQMLESVKALSFVQDQAIEIPIDHHVRQNYPDSYTIAVDLSSIQSPATKRALGTFQLLPSFQCCNVARFYYFAVQIQFGDHFFDFNIPVSIVN